MWRSHFGATLPLLTVWFWEGVSTLGKAECLSTHVSSLGPKAASVGGAYLVAAGHNDVLWLRHDTALLGHQCVLDVAREAVGREEAVVLLHTELLP